MDYYYRFFLTFFFFLLDFNIIIKRIHNIFIIFQFTWRYFITTIIPKLFYFSNSNFSFIAITTILFSFYFIFFVVYLLFINIFLISSFSFFSSTNCPTYLMIPLFESRIFFFLLSSWIALFKWISMELSFSSTWFIYILLFINFIFLYWILFLIN